MENIKHDIILRVNKDSVLLFDMDGTLIDTDFANFLSYKCAIENVIKLEREIQYNLDERFNRSNLNTFFLGLSKIQYEEIIKQKEEKYNEHLLQTKLNKAVADILVRYSGTNTTVLVTNCREDRALMTLNYHSLTDKFKYLLFKQISTNETRINKYKNAISSLSLSAQNVIVFENEKAEIDDAILAGISIDNIVSLKL